MHEMIAVPKRELVKAVVAAQEYQQSMNALLQESEDGEWRKTREQATRDIAQAFGVSPELMGDTHFRNETTWNMDSSNMSGTITFEQAPAAGENMTLASTEAKEKLSEQPQRPNRYTRRRTIPRQWGTVEVYACGKCRKPFLGPVTTICQCTVPKHRQKSA